MYRATTGGSKEDPNSLDVGYVTFFFLFFESKPVVPNDVNTNLLFKGFKKVGTMESTKGVELNDGLGVQSLW